MGLHWRLSSVFVLSILAYSCTSGDRKPPEPKYPIAISDVIQKDVPIFIDAIGNVGSLQTVTVRPQVGGIIQEAYVKQGQYVKKGDPIFKIDPRPYQAALDKAKAALIKDEANLEFTQIRLKRNADLLKQDYIAKLTYDQYISDADSAQGQVLSDYADIELAQIYLDWCTPVSPIDGKISQYAIDPGNLVIANDPNSFTDIRQITPSDIHFNIAQKDFVDFQKARKEGTDKIQVFLPHDSQNGRDGTIYFVDNHVDLSSGTILLKGSVPNEDELFWPGEYVKVRVIFRVQPKALLVPEEALQTGQEGPYLYIYNSENSTAEYRPVVKGEHIDRLFLIEKGVNAGEKVITKGQINLRPGVKVYIPEEQPTNAKSSS